MMPPSDLNAATLHWLNDLAPQGIFTTDTTLTIRSWNRWLEQQTGHPAGSVVGRSLLDLYPHLVERRLDRYYHNALAGQIQVLAQRFHQYLIPLPPSSPAGNLPAMPQSVRIAPLAEAGQVIGTITVIDDVTDRVVREAELRAAVQVRDQFVSVAAHELRTPLTALLSSAQLLQRRMHKTAEADPRNNRTLAVLVQQGQRLNTMIQGLLDLSRIETGQLTLDLRPMDLAALTRQLAEEIQPTLDQHKIVLDVPAHPVLVDGDALRLEQVLHNLINNAVKYSPAGGAVEVRLRTDTAEVCLVVQDRGIGIPADSLPHLFTRFYRATNVESRAIAGFGIGLYVVAQIVESHHGTISVESHEGQGSIFTVCLPPADPPAPTGQSAPFAAER